MPFEDSRFNGFRYYSLWPMMSQIEILPEDLQGEWFHAKCEMFDNIAN